MTDTNDIKPIIGITTDIQVIVKNESFVIERTYPRAVANAGGIPFFIPTLPDNRSLLKDIAAKIDGLVLPGGRDMDPRLYNEDPHPKLRPINPARTKSEMILLEEALKRNIPVLGICNGMQLINIFFGGSLYQDIPSQIPDALSHEDGSEHEVSVHEDTLLQKVIKEKSFRVRSYHHQSAKAIGRGLRVSAVASDGIVEAVEAADSFVLGIQWHPEREEKSEISDRIFQALMNGRGCRM